MQVETAPDSELPPPPLTTVELLDKATFIFGLSSQQIMGILQWLYERGFISYPRTDVETCDPSVNLEVS